MRYLFAAVLAVTLTAPDAFAQDRPSAGAGLFSGWTGNANAAAGLKTLDKDDWGAADSHPALHLDFDARPQNWPVSLAAQLNFSAGDGNEDDGAGGSVKIEGQTQELNLGVRKVWEPTESLRPFLGGGLSLIRAEFTTQGESDSDLGTGVWLGAGASWQFTNRFKVGVEADWTKADVTLFDTTGDAGGLYFGLMGGYQF